MSTHTFGSVTIDTATLPATSIEALLRRGLSHVFGNEVASKISARKAAAVKPETEGGPARPELSDDEITELRNHFVAAAAKALAEGTLGQHTPKAAVDPLEAEMRKIAKGLVVLKLQAAKLKTPTKGEAVKFKSGQEFTLDELIDRQIAKEDEAIRKEAKQVLAAKAKKASKATEGVTEDASIEDMGL